MATVILVVHLILALCLIAVVLLQRSEGGALGIGGGGGGLVSQRGAGNALTKLTWGLAIAFLITSISLTIVAGGGTRSVTDDFDAPVQDTTTFELPSFDDDPVGEGEGLALPPASDDSGDFDLDDAGTLLPAAPAAD
ncbi:MAG: preprotein translocase subunit SecG [Pseudomonadota bacterium]